MKTFKEFTEEQSLQEFKFVKPAMRGEMSLLGLLGSFALGGFIGPAIYSVYKIIVTARERDKMGCNKDPWPKRCMLLKHIEVEKQDIKFIKTKVMKQKNLGSEEKGRVQAVLNTSQKRLAVLEKDLKKLDQGVLRGRGVKQILMPT